jgi:hypothetical protein
MKSALKLRNFYRIYGRYMEYAEIVLFALIVLVFAFQEYSLDFAALTAGPSLFAFILSVAVHVIICIQIASSEFYPYKTLRLNSLNSLFYRVLLGSSLFIFVVLFLISNFFPMEFLYGNLLILILQHCAFMTTKMVIVFLFFQLSWSSDFKRSRLALRTVLIGLRLIDREDKRVDRADLVSKYLRWFNVGLNSYNRFLYKRKPKHMGIVEIGDYYRSIHCAGLIGNRAERATLSRQVRLALDSIGGGIREGGFRQFLIAMKNIKNIENKERYPLSDLNRMVRVLSFSERAKEWLKSPWFTAIVSFITIFSAALPFIL